MWNVLVCEWSIAILSGTIECPQRAIEQLNYYLSEVSKISGS